MCAGRGERGGHRRFRERAVHRLTGELADWYGLDAGHLRVGDWADPLIDPSA